MSTHNISFYDDLTKIIFELSSNIIKYAPYFFCCNLHAQKVSTVALCSLSKFFTTCSEPLLGAGVRCNIWHIRG